MPSLLFEAPSSLFTPSESFALKQAEMNVHRAILGIFNVVQEILPASIHGQAAETTLRGLTSATGRLTAEAMRPMQASLFIQQFSGALALEYRYWLGLKRLS